jgi:diguanylate cyclase (GGDEF)-like protein
MVIAENLRKKIASHSCPSKNGKLKVTMSLGVATYPVHAADKTSLIEAADKAMYRAKEMGKNKVEPARNK